MTTRQEAAQQAAEELENCADLLMNFEAPSDSCVGKTITSANAAAEVLRAALANEAQAEPHGWLLRWPIPGGGHSWHWHPGKDKPTHVPFPSVPLYTHPAPAGQPGAVGLSEREAFEKWADKYPALEDDQGYVNLRYLGLHKQYVDFDVQRAWVAWQARAALASTQPADPLQALHDEQQRLGLYDEVAPGWRLVPVEPTEAMLNAARDWSVKKYGIGVGNDAAIGCYAAMLAATQGDKTS